MRPTPKTLKKVKVPEKPKITLNLSDRLNQAQMWLSDTLSGLIAKAIQYIIPAWWYWAFLGIMLSLVILYGWLQ